MNALPESSTLLRRVVALIAMVVLATSAIAAVASWWHDPFAVTAPKVKAPRASGVKCAECGTVASTREVASPIVDSADRRYEITVRMNDGSSRVFVDASLASWRPGVRLILIEAVD
jgi:hypothetical protein